MTPSGIHLRPIICSLAYVVLTTLSLHAQWSRTTGIEGGFAADLLSTPQALLVCLENGGVYRSTDDGTTWHFASSGLTGQGPGGYAFAALGSEVYLASGNGISKSVDDGQTWTTVNNGLFPWGTAVASLAVSGTNAIFAGTSGGIYRSTDHGALWSKTSSGLTDSMVLALVSTATHLFAGTPTGVFRSSDGGASWQGCNTGLAAGDGRDIRSITAMSGGVVVGTRQGVYTSTDNGTTWTPAASGLTSYGVSALLASGADLFAGTYGAGVYRSTNGGADWVQSSQGWSGGNVRALRVHNGRLFGGHYGVPVVYRSTNNGVTWVPSGSGITSELTRAIVSNNSRVYAATHSGVYLTSDNGATWIAPSSPLVMNDIYALFLKGSVVFAGTPGNGPVMTTDAGTSWSSAIGDLPTGDSRTTLSFAADSTFLYMGTSAGVYRSTNNGVSWVAARLGLTDSATSALCASGGRLFAGTNKGMYISTNSGSSWTVIPTGIPRYSVRSIVTIDHAILAAVSNIPSIYKSTDNGESWQPVTEGLSGAVVQTLVVSGSTVFGGSTYKGVWESTDNGETWIDIGAGLSGPGLKIIGLTASAGNLFAASSNGGIWKRPLSQVVSAREPSPRAPLSQFTLDQNYPNPFNPSTTIRYGLATTSIVHLGIYDLLGREVGALVDQRSEAGSYEVRFNGRGLSSGVYVYRLSAGSTTLSRAMLLLR